ncbi:unnamed protein product [Diamesa serratosioi]
MCISFIYVNPGNLSIKYKLVIANNRDEFYERTTLAANYWKSNDQIISGLDCDGATENGLHGTWLAISADDNIIKFGNLLNIAGEKKHSNGRGPIVSSFMSENLSVEDYNIRLLDVSQLYNSFNFVSAEINLKTNETKSFITSNVPHSSTIQLPYGFLGFSNSPYNKPYKKVQYGIPIFQEIVENQKDENLVTMLMTFLQSDKKCWPDEQLLERRGEFAEPLSSICVNAPDVGYGSRTRTIILVDEFNNVDYYEETLDSSNGEWLKTHLKLKPKT